MANEQQDFRQKSLKIVLKYEQAGVTASSQLFHRSLPIRSPERLRFDSIAKEVSSRTPTFGSLDTWLRQPSDMELPPVLSQPQYAIRVSQAPEQPVKVEAVEPAQHFRPELDTARRRGHSVGFNRVRATADQTFSAKFKGNVNSRLRQSIAAAEQSDDSTSTSPPPEQHKRSRSASSLPSPSPRRERVKRTRKIHDRALGLSMTPTAIDYRQRHKVEAQYRERLALLLDDDIVDEVDAEGGITPLGRLFKASVRQMERVKAERAGTGQRTGTVQVKEGEISHNDEPVQRIAELERQLARIKNGMRELFE